MSLTYEQLVQDNADGPQISGVVIWQLLHQLWSHIKRSSFDRPSGSRLKVRKFPGSKTLSDQLTFFAMK